MNQTNLGSQKNRENFCLHEKNLWFIRTQMWFYLLEIQADFVHIKKKNFDKNDCI